MASINDKLTYEIIGCAMEVHNALGNGFQEVIYQRCLAIELQNAGIPFQREVEQPIFYKGSGVGKRRADFIIDNKLVVELKAVISLEDAHLAQAKNYLTAYNFDIGLLINFGSQSLGYKRIFRTEKRASKKSYTVWSEYGKGNPENSEHPNLAHPENPDHPDAYN
ncbi:MAG: GxxExxY protein [Bacteroidetes bacterium]|nr:GxxExxY protein [Bacteroidota bacterium]